ncbi:hypothetical protein [Rhizobium leguminosarum]|uniref:hypothetical protein n=1 Tax=Rhizobium leguminosarum TaxID=384 RepID=UPI001F44023A|nr:hypothetical protein [Rhizobium leguminosarum]UIJ83135.1 hypothetical protein LZK78_32135 [Rhizobium leguminosarum]
MTKINHDRPTLRLLDNYRRELKSQAKEYKKFDNVHITSANKNRMPTVSQAAQEIILSIFDAANVYFDASSSYLKTMLPDAGKSLRKKKMSLQKELEDAKSNLVNSCVKILIEAMREKLEGKKGVVAWLSWLQEEAHRTNNYGLFDILELGIKPAFEKIDTAVAGGSLR